MRCDVGIDLTEVDEVRQAMRTFGPRYLERIYSEQERRDCDDDPRRLAARFAAKEAAMKALGRGDEGIGWRSIEVIADEHGRPGLRLTGAAAALASRRGVGSLALSLTHERGQAAAVVVAEAAS